MTHYLLSIYQPDGPVPDAETMSGVAAKLHTLNEQLQASGAWSSPPACTHRTAPP
jgi:hypothetical protein